MTHRITTEQVEAWYNAIDEVSKQICWLKAEGNIVEVEDSAHPWRSPRVLKELTLDIMAEHAISLGAMLQGVKCGLNCTFK